MTNQVLESPFPRPDNSMPGANEPFISGPPTPAIIEAIEYGTAAVSRRVEFYEADGVTVWDPEGDGLIQSRLVDGTVSVDYGRAERRSVDMSLDNTDSLLRPNPNGGLWYDKVIKPFRGVRVAQKRIQPRVLIIEEDAANQGYAFRDIIWQLGFTRVDVMVGATTLEQIADYEIIVSYMRTEKTTKAALLAQAYAAGKKIISVGAKSSQTEIPLISASAGASTYAFALNKPPEDNPLNASWTTETGATLTTVVRPTALGGSARRVAYKSADNTITAMIDENRSTGARWFHYQLSAFGTQGKVLLQNALNWLWNYQPYVNWETQVGEFCIDNLSEANFPHITKLTGRDYTKRCLQSKIEKTLSFAAGTPVMLIVTALGANAGLVKFRLPDSDAVITSRLDVERGTERWSIMSQAAESANFELFVDRWGYLTARQYLDPSFGAISWTFKTGREGNLVSWNRSINDSRLYNHIVITGEREDGLVPFFGEAINDEPSSPTRVARIGDRSYFYTSSFFTSDEQCIELAKSWLNIHSLESYEIDWQSFNYPWLEAGEVIEFLDPARLDFEPTRFLMDTLTIPLGLGPMSATGKRVTFVGDSNLYVPPGEDEV